MNDCIFCKIVMGIIPSSKIYEDDLLLAFMDIQPVNEGHLLIIPKEHKELISDVNEETLGKMFVLAGKLNTAIRKAGIKAEGINFFLADGESAGQEVLHTHLHLIPRFTNDGFGLKFPEGYRTNPPERDKLNITADKIKSGLL